MTHADTPTSGTTTRPNGLGRILFLLALLALAVTGLRTIATPGIWTHIATGHDIAAHGIPRHATLTFALSTDTKWVDTSWLYDVFVHALWNGGGPSRGAALITVVHVIAVVFAMVVLAVSAWRRGSEAWATGLAVAMAAWLALPVFSPDPLLLALVFPALFLALGSSRMSLGSLRIVLPLVQVLWTNLHESFLLGPVLLALFAVDARRDEARQEKPKIASRQLWILAGAALGATLINPYFLGLHTWLIGVWSDAARNITLNAAPAFGADFASSLFLRGRYVIVGIILLGLVVIRQRLSVATTAAALLGAFLLVRSTSLAPISSVLAFPFLCQCLTALAQSYPIARTAGTALAAAVSAILIVFTTSSSAYQKMALLNRFGLGVENEAYPMDVSPVLAKAAFPTNCLNLAPDGGFLSVRLPARQIYCDTRGSLYGAGFYDQFAQAMLGDAAALESIEKKFAPGAILLNCTWPLCGTAGRVLMAQGRWSLAYFDGSSALFVRNTPENQQFIRDRELQQSGLNNLESSRSAYFARMGRGNGNSARLIGAGYFLIGMGHYREAEIVYRVLAQGSPTMIGAWRGLGIAQQQLGQHAEAIASLNRAIGMRSNDPLAYLWLSVALRDVGRTEDSEAAITQARNLNAKLAESFLKNPPPKPAKESGS